MKPYFFDTPPFENDEVGWVYVYFMDKHKKIREDGEEMLLKIGLTKHEPHRRVTNTAKTNNCSYTIIKTYKTKYMKFMEWTAHKYFRNRRVVLKKLQDGKTEWFFVKERDVVNALNRIKLAMLNVFGDENEKNL